jgi:methionyl-tRNA formyltransferase
VLTGVARDHLIILLMGDLEADFFRTHLGDFPGRSFRQAQSVAELRRRLRSAPAQVRIISFCSRVIVPPDVIAKYAGQCFNFHPGPPDFPGFRPSRAAAMKGVSTFGVTFHTMVEEVDAGPIHEVRRFPVPDGVSRSDLDALTFHALVRLAREMAPRLANPAATFPASSERWGGSA